MRATGLLSAQGRNSLARIPAARKTPEGVRFAAAAGSSSPSVLAGLLRPLVRDLPAGDLFHRHGEVVLRAGLDQRRRRLVEADSLAQLVVVVVDLARALGGDDHERVAGTGGAVEQRVDTWIDHGRVMVPALSGAQDRIRSRGCRSR